MKILIIEDEQKTGDYLKQGLSEAGFAFHRDVAGLLLCPFCLSFCSRLPGSFF